MSLDKAQISVERERAGKDINSTLTELNSIYPDAMEGLSTALGASLGGAGSFAALYFGGTVGLSAAGLTSGLATAGALVGGGMAAGIGVLAAPVAVLGVLGYAIAKKKKNAKYAAALTTAIEKLYNIQNRLMANAEYFQEELADIKTTIDHLKQKKGKL